MLDSAAENSRAEREHFWIGQGERKTASQKRIKVELGCGE